MKIINSGLISPESPLHSMEAEWVYNALDCCVTFEVDDVLEADLTLATQHVYSRSLSMMAPILEMNMRGVLVDQAYREELQRQYGADVARLTENLDRLTFEALDRKINWGSPTQVKDVFYNVLQIPPVKKRNANGQMVPTVNREALEKMEGYFYARPFINHLLSIRDITKRMEMLAANVDRDGRIRTSYNIAGTNTGRLSSSFSDFGTGRNLQNIEERLRRVFVADPGMKFANIDLEQADSRNIGGYIWKIFGDSTYLDACESGDLHTTVARMTMPELPWPEELKDAKAFAEATPFFRRDSLRQASKKIGHASNYYGKPPGIAKITGFDVKLIKGFQPRYFGAFPNIPAFHTWCYQQLINTGIGENLFERPRHFAGRRTDDSTLREYIAFCGQSSTADFVNEGMLNVWRLHNCQLLLQVHDSLLVQYPEDREAEILPAIMDALHVTIPIRGRDFSIPWEAKVGWNWSNYSSDNVDGLRKFGGNDTRKRQRLAGSKLNFLDRRFL